MSRRTQDLCIRLYTARCAVFGENGVPRLSAALGVPARTWENVEAGVSAPAWLVLEFIELTGVRPHWLLTGEGDPFTQPETAPRGPRSRRS